MTQIFPLYDAIVVGAGVAGTAAAILLAKAGLSVSLVDPKRSMTDHKSLCTHFVQPVGNHVFADLGASDLLGPECSIATQAKFFVPGGTIDAPTGYGKDDIHSSAHNLERRVMDPLLRQLAAANGVDIKLATRVIGLERSDDLFTAHMDGAQAGSVRARYVIAADGRMSDIARLVAAPTQTTPNDRFAYFIYGHGIAAPQDNRSLFVLNNAEMSFLYPLIGERTLLSVYVKSDSFGDWGTGRTRVDHLIDQFKRHLPDVDFNGFTPQTPVMGYKRYDNQLRPAVTNDIAFVGDAALSLDPMSGVGCSFGLMSARFLADAIGRHGPDRNAALAEYETAHAEFFSPHASGIMADARVAKSEETSRKIYATILQDDRLKQRYLDLTGRLVTPSQFQKSYLVGAAKQAAAQQKRAMEPAT
ncbi:NAD(P)/FAD-dependent oxidoreductase [Puniceibacterium sediminis]|uniref:Dehydrogenase (Flavoprotein) n=1 Tax=Puniceibacterium sediminis TaxID=1608407 RepID=A0A238YUR9_9RHOB|nr:NAD(P)/FAD-dependent oxidoreductase [Puniceibacterium sediminis]SNR74461.1 Dehydrogenase (flavoprotein) [Puniceibacterium sediminis]